MAWEGHGRLFCLGTHSLCPETGSGVWQRPGSGGRRGLCTQCRWQGGRAVWPGQHDQHWAMGPSSGAVLMTQRHCTGKQPTQEPVGARRCSVVPHAGGDIVPAQPLPQAMPNAALGLPRAPRHRATGRRQPRHGDTAGCESGLRTTGWHIHSIQWGTQLQPPMPHTWTIPLPSTRSGDRGDQRQPAETLQASSLLATPQLT